MHYENAPGYPEFKETDEKGKPSSYPMFGYPQVMLDTAIARDDPVGFEFYFTRHFASGFEIFGSEETLDQFCERKKAPKCAEWVRKNGRGQQTKVTAR